MVIDQKLKSSPLPTCPFGQEDRILPRCPIHIDLVQENVACQPSHDDQTLHLLAGAEKDQPKFSHKLPWLCSLQVPQNISHIKNKNNTIQKNKQRRKK